MRDEGDERRPRGGIRNLPPILRFFYRSLYPSIVLRSPQFPLASVVEFFQPVGAGRGGGFCENASRMAGGENNIGGGGEGGQRDGLLLHAITSTRCMQQRQNVCVHDRTKNYSLRFGGGHGNRRARRMGTLVGRTGASGEKVAASAAAGRNHSLRSITHCARTGPFLLRRPNLFFFRFAIDVLTGFPKKKGALQSTSLGSVDALQPHPHCVVVGGGRDRRREGVGQPTDDG